MDQTPSSYEDRMDQVLGQLLKAASQQEAQDRFNDLREELSEEAPSALDVLEDGFFEATAVLALPGKYRRRLRTTNMVERFIQEIRRREKPIRIFPNQESVYRLVGALCAETHEEWSTGRCYFDMEEFFEWKASHLQEDSSEENFPDNQVSSTGNSVDRDETMIA
jgi:transposase-like protein